MKALTILKKVKRFETFSKTPELNKVHFKDGTEISTAGKTKLNEAIQFIIQNNML